VKIQLRNYYCCDAHVVEVAEGSIRDDRIAKGGPKSPESLARGMFPKGFPRNPGELAISPLTRAVTRIAKGDRRRPRMDGRAVLKPIAFSSTRTSPIPDNTGVRNGSCSDRISLRFAV
jgi:hypothetical protein